MCGEGGMPVSEWRRMRDVGLAELWVKGYAKRHKTMLQVGRVLARVTAHCVAKDLPDDFPYMIEDDQEADTRTDEEKAQEMQEAQKRLEAALDAMNKQNIDNGKR